MAASASIPSPQARASEEPAPLQAQAAVGELRPTPRDRKPLFRLDDLGGAPTSLDHFAGRPVLLHFFATWCEPCRPEMEALARLAQRVSAQELSIVSVSVAEPDIRVRRFLAPLGLRFPVLLDRDREAAKAWGVAQLPTTFLLDAELAPRFMIDRDLDWDRVDPAALVRSLRLETNGAEDGGAPIKPSSQGGS